MPRYTGTTLDGDYVWVDISLSSQNYGTNQSVVDWAYGWQFNPPSPTYREVRNAAVAIDGSLRHSNGGTVIGNSSGNANKSVTIASGQAVVAHDANGYGSVALSAYAHPFFNNNFGTSSGVSGTYGLPRIPKPPAQNGAPTVSNLLPTTALFSWPGSTNDNGAPITEYLLRIHTNSNVEVAGYVDYPVSAATVSKSVTGLIPGTQYYAAVYARNSQGYGPKSTTTAFKTPSGMYVWNGLTDRPSEVLVWSGTEWKTSTEVLEWDGTVWKTAI